MSYGNFDNLDKMLETEMRRHSSPFNYEGKAFSYLEYIDANKTKDEMPTQLEGPHDKNDAWMNIDKWTGQEDVISAFRGSGKGKDRVNSPAHYTRGKQEAIDIIEDAIQDAPSVAEGMLQAQVLKYMLRVWLKDNPMEDLQKAQWYLSRLIDKQEEEQ